MSKSKADLIVSAAITPELLAERHACAFFNFGPTMFRRLRMEGEIPAPISIPGSRLKMWRRAELQAVIDKWAADPRRRLTA